MSRIFISHSGANNDRATQLRDWLLENGWDDIFLDLDSERGIAAGERWKAALQKAAQHCEAVLALVSPEWLASDWCRAELNTAELLGKKIFVLLIGCKGSHIAGSLKDAQYVDLINDPDAYTRLKVGLNRAGLDARYFRWPPENDPDRTPYRGLRPLEAEDAGIFFGRDGPTVDGLDQLRELREGAPPRLLVILGASGGGKSSFLRAGLLPRLDREDQHFLSLPVIRPERAVLTNESSGLVASLEKALGEAKLGHTRAEIRRAVESGAASAASLLTELVNANTPSRSDDGTRARKPPTLVLAIDQAEELFHAEGAEEAHPFLDLLRELVAKDTPALIALFTIRSDSYERLQEAKELDGVRKVPFDLSPMPKGAYAEVIKGPARRLEDTNRPLKIEETLVDALLADIEEGGAKDALPLLAFTLERLYLEQGGEGDLKLSEYEELGRVRGSIEAAVERALKAADADPKIPRDRKARLALLRRGLIPWLAGINPDTGAPRRCIARQSEIPAESRPLIDLLVEQRLLSTDVAKDTGEVTIEPVHEALLRQWGLLQGWLADDAGLLAVMDGVKRASRDWAANGKDAAWLTHTADRLKTAERLAERPDLAAKLEPTDRDYLAACHNAERMATVRKRRVGALFGVLAFGILAAGVGWLNTAYLKRQYHWILMGPAVLTPERERSLKPGEVFSECETSCPQMTVIPPGTFTMGSAWGTVNDNERPDHPVTIPKPFAAGIYEVTIAEWNACAAAGGGGQRRSGCSALPDPGPDRQRLPASYISWEDAQRYVSWLSEVSGKNYRLLTEAEWEYANRGGSTTRYSFGDDESSVGEYAWYDANSQTQPHLVGGKKPNAFGLFDMHGNVWEWVEDCWHDTYERAPKDGSPWTQCVDDKIRVLRGGSAADKPAALRTALRAAKPMGARLPTYGFRVARTINP